MELANEWSTPLDEFAPERTEALVTQIVAAGFAVIAEENGYSVALAQRAPLSLREARGRQVGVFTTTHAGEFRWGWVEKRNGNGRTDFHTERGSSFDTFLASLTHRHRTNQ